MQVTAPRIGYIIIPAGRTVNEFLNEPVEILWDDEQVKNIVRTMTFHGEKDNPPTVVPIQVGFPIEIEDGVINQRPEIRRGAQPQGAGILRAFRPANPAPQPINPNEANA